MNKRLQASVPGETGAFLVEETQRRNVSSASISSTSLLDNDFNRLVSDDMDNKDITTEKYLDTATQYLHELSPSVTIGTDLNLAALPILQSFLIHAPNDHGQRYVSCAIISSCRSASLGMREEGLANLARYWLKFLLIPVKSAYRIYTPRNTGRSSPTISEAAKPTVDKTSHFARNLFKRQNGECAAIADGERMFKNVSEGAHIIKRSLATVDTASGDVSSSPATTWDIVSDFSGISASDLEKAIDSPENGVYMEISMHKQFDQFKWCLIPTDTPHRYSVKWFCKPVVAYWFAKRDFVEFKNHHSKHIELPNPKFIALHTALAHILQESGVGEFLDNAMEIFIPKGAVLDSQKFNEQDIALRLSLRALAGENLLHLPNELVVL